ncbi:MAG: ABC transporter permease [Myxococcota bacterium]
MSAELLILVSQTVLIAVPLILAALGGVASERTGVVNIALEAMLLSGAFLTAIVAHASGDAWLGVLGGLLGGLLIAALHALLVLWVKADPVISGLALNLLATGASEYGSKLYWVSDAPRALPALPSGELGRPLVWITFALVALFAFVLSRTALGLRLTAVGENPDACETAGISALGLRWLGVLLSGLFSGLGGAWLALNVGQFQHGMSAGKGYIAVAAVVFGRWRPIGATLACLLFAGSEALAAAMERWQLGVPSELVGTLPYVLTIVAMAGLVGRARPPAALGKR